MRNPHWGFMLHVNSLYSLFFNQNDVYTVTTFTLTRFTFNTFTLRISTLTLLQYSHLWYSLLLYSLLRFSHSWCLNNIPTNNFHTYDIRTYDIVLAREMWAKTARRAKADKIQRKDILGKFIFLRPRVLFGVVRHSEVLRSAPLLNTRFSPMPQYANQM